MSCTSNKGITARHWELNVVWKCNIYIHPFFKKKKYYSAFFWFMFYLWLSCDKPGLFVSEYVISTHTKPFVRFWLFTFTRFLTKHTSSVKCFCCTHHFIAGPHLFLIVQIFYATEWQRNTRAYLSWARVCWHCLIIYVLCCCTCPNTNIVLNICFTFVCVITIFSYASSYWLVIYNLSDGLQNPHMVVDLKRLTLSVLYWTFQPIIYNDRESFYYFLHGYIRRRHWVFFSFFPPVSAHFTLQDFLKEVVHIYDKESTFELKG